MGKNNKNALKKRKKASSSSDEQNTSKIHRRGGPDRGNSASDSDNSDKSDILDTEENHKTKEVSDILNETNSVLFNESAVFPENELKQLSDCEKPSTSTAMASTQPSPRSNGSSAPTNIDLMDMLKKIDSRICNVETKLLSLDKLEKKVEEFDSDIKKLWLNMDKINKQLGDKMVKMDERVEAVEFNAAQQQSLIDQLERDNNRLKDSMSYIQSQSMRNNLIFCNIPEDSNEKPAETENIIRHFMTEKLKIAQEQVDLISMERVHRMGRQQAAQGRPRKIVCKFTLFKDRETVRQKSKELRGSDFYIHEQFPPEVVPKRKALLPHLKKARQENKTAWISYDTLYVQGRPVKID